VTTFLVDSNVLLDITTGNPVWADWSQRQLDDVWRDGQVVVNPIIYAEMSLNFAGVEALDSHLLTLGPAVLEIPRAALFLAARVYCAPTADAAVPALVCCPTSSSAPMLLSKV
jgi:hypothetical protein